MAEHPIVDEPLSDELQLISQENCVELNDADMKVMQSFSNLSNMQLQPYSHGDLGMSLKEVFTISKEANAAHLVFAETRIWRSLVGSAHQKEVKQIVTQFMIQQYETLDNKIVQNINDVCNAIQCLETEKEGYWKYVIVKIEGECVSVESDAEVQANMDTFQANQRQILQELASIEQELPITQFAEWLHNAVQAEACYEFEYRFDLFNLNVDVWQACYSLDNYTVEDYNEMYEFWDERLQESDDTDDMIA